MIGGRWGWSALVIAGALVLFFVVTRLGPPIANITWAAPALALAICILIARAGVIHHDVRDGLALAAAAAFVGTAGVPVRAFWRLGIWLWLSARQGDAGISVGMLGRFKDVASAIWATDWPALSFWVALVVFPVMAALAVGVPAGKRVFEGSREVEGGPFKAAWMATARLRELTRNKEGLPIGLLGGKICRFVANPERGWKGGHSLVISGTRGGKGVSAVNPAIIDHAGPVAVIDIKGELWAMTHRHRAELGRKVLLLDPFGITNGVGNRFNPLTFVRDDPRHMVGDIAVIAEGLVRGETGNGEHFVDNARGLVRAAIETVMRVEVPEGRTLRAVSAMLFGSNADEMLAAWRDNPSAVGVDVSETAAMLLGLGDKERGAFFSTLRRGFEWASSEPMRDFLSASDFSLDDFFDDAIDLYIAIPLHQLGAQATFMRLMVNLLLATVMREAGHRRVKRNVLLVLDEFTRMGRMEKMLDIATAANGLGLEALFVIQNKAQVDEAYGEHGASTLLSACATTRAWNLGRGDHVTAEWLSRLLGERTVETASRDTKSKRRDGRSEQRAPLMSAAEILEMGQDEMLVLFDGQRPAKLKRIISYRDRHYSAKFDPNPTLPK